MKTNTIKISGKTSKELDDLMRKRKENGDFVNSKVAIVAELVQAQHKKDIKRVK